MGEIGIEEVDVDALAAVDDHRFLGVEVVREDIAHLESVLDRLVDVRERIRIARWVCIQYAGRFKKCFVVAMAGVLWECGLSTIAGDCLRVDVDE